MSGYLSDRLEEIISYHANAKVANLGRVGSMLFNAGKATRSFFGSASKVKPPVPPVKPLVPPVKPPVPPVKPPVPPVKSPVAGAAPKMPKAGPAAPTTAPETPPAETGGWKGTLWNGAKNVGSQLVLGSAVAAAPDAYNYFFPGSQPGVVPGSPSGNPNDFYSQFSNFYNQNPALARQVSPQFHSLLSRQDELRNYFNKTGQMVVDPMQPQQQNPQASAYAQQSDGDEVIPEEQLMAAKELLLKDEMQAEMQKFKQQRQKAVMDRLKSDPDGAAVIKHMETHGKPVTPDTIKAEGQQLAQQHSQAQSQGDVRPFDQWVSDMMQPQAQNFAFDAGVARRKMAEMELDFSDPYTASIPTPPAVNNFVNKAKGAITGMGSALLQPFVSVTGGPAAGLALSLSRSMRGISSSPPAPVKPYDGPNTIRGYIEYKTPTWMHSYFAPDTLGGATIDSMDRAGASKRPARPAYEVEPTIQPATITPTPPAGQTPRQTIQPATLTQPKTTTTSPSSPTTPPTTPPATSTATPATPPTVASTPKPQSNLNQRMRSMQTSGSLQNAFIKRQF